MKALSKDQTGFTVIEFAVLIVIMGILAVVVVTRGVNLTPMRANVAASRIKQDIRYAQKEAAAGYVRTWVVFDDANERYTLYSGDDKPSRTPMINPLTRDDYIVQLDEDEYSGVEITGVNFDGKSEVEFDSMGTPFDGDNNRLTSDGKVTLNGSIDIVVTYNTGMVKVEE